MTVDTLYNLKKSEHGYMYIDPLPSDAEIREFYAQEFYSGEYKNFNNSSLEVQERDAEYHELQRKLLLGSIESLLEAEIKNKEVLDFGCGWGLTLEFLRRQGAQCYGVDPAPEAVEYCQKNGLNVLVGDIDNFGKFEEKTFDAILMQNVLEHLKEPVKALQLLAQRLKPGGVLVVAVPNDFNALQMTAVELLNLRQWWVAPPAHLNYFNRESLSRVIEACGLNVAKAECSFPLEMFLLFGHDYISNPEIGRQAHEMRMKFEMALAGTGRSEVLQNFYKALGQADLGRILTAFAIKPKK